MSTPPVGSLLNVCLSACDAVAPLANDIYDLVSVNSARASNLKADKSYFSLADGIIQALMMRLLRPRLGGFVGEEDEEAIHIDEEPFRAGGLIAPESIAARIRSGRQRIEELAAILSEQSENHDDWLGLTAFVDPIDGTREFCTGKGAQCTICIGFADGAGAPIGGLVYRLLDSPPTWVMGCAKEGLLRSQLRAAASRPGFVCSNGSLSPFVEALASELGYDLHRAGGAGNKMMLLLEGTGRCYIQDRGVSRWDTCAAQAVLEAHGGALAKLSRFAAEQQLASYSYVASDINADFESGLALLCSYNARGPVPVPEEGDPTPRATCAEQLKTYANVCGLLALPASELPLLPKYYEAVCKVAAMYEPAYN
eukprot:CAMPEP_0119364276 /NCGR_PEP_ID=MMETSP1334-20130426/11196_1 /TAXON_ID=127549 /ORGANISM="Calcidiscus leptoporus, Strain RCC1130" /LENGTH=367 /DNA_ID=CAMNT_0007379931 /DNA_START=53 /DNA_END=1156 /DNA_ORIENTATION=-